MESEENTEQQPAEANEPASKAFAAALEAQAQADATNSPPVSDAQIQNRAPRTDPPRFSQARPPIPVSRESLVDGASEKSDQENREDLYRKLATPLSLKESSAINVKPDPNNPNDAEDIIPRGLSAHFVLIRKTGRNKLRDHNETIVVRGYSRERDGDDLRRVDGSSQNIQFIEGHLAGAHCVSMSVARFLFNSKLMGVNWDINVEDPGGFWRAVGLVEEVPTVETRRVMQKKVG